ALIEGGVDLILLETFGSMLEAAEAVRAVRGLSRDIPIAAQMTFLSDGRTAFGETASHALSTLVLAGADVVGMNCTLGPQETSDASRGPRPPSPWRSRSSTSRSPRSKPLA